MLGRGHTEQIAERGLPQTIVIVFFMRPERLAGRQRHVASCGGNCPLNQTASCDEEKYYM
jgi:hypothetical protein